MKNNVIAFDRARKPAMRATVHTATEAPRGTVISLAEYRDRARTRRTANGVFFSTGVLGTFGSAA